MTRSQSALIGNTVGCPSAASTMAAINSRSSSGVDQSTPDPTEELEVGIAGRSILHHSDHGQAANPGAGNEHAGVGTSPIQVEGILEEVWHSITIRRSTGSRVRAGER